MSLFDSLVSQALKAQGELAPLRVVVEKELLHHDILREMSAAGLLHSLTFIGGTCLRACYGSNRLSEDLNFTGGKDFKRETLAGLGNILVERLQVKYGLEVAVSEPVKETGNVDTWKLKVTTHPRRKSLPAQRIHIDICAVPSYDRKPMTLRNFYDVEMGTSGLIVQAQSREEIFADKMVAFVLRMNRIKNRDLWDIGWLKQQNVTLPLELVGRKIADHKRSVGDFVDLLDKRMKSLKEDPAIQKDFVHEMRRFLPPQVILRTVEKEEFWVYLVDLVHREGVQVVRHLVGEKESDVFLM